MYSSFLSPALAVAVTAYTIGVASPGPSNMAIMATAMSQGRAHALAMAGGVVSGSVFWGLAAGLGMSALMRNYSWALVVLKLFGGCYMLWLAWKAARVALDPVDRPLAEGIGAGGYRASFLRGLSLHLTNPKAIFVWLSIVALGLPPDAPRSQTLYVVGICAGIGLLVFAGYALAFSAAGVRAAYIRLRRWLNGALSAVFAYAGVRLLMSHADPT